MKLLGFLLILLIGAVGVYVYFLPAIVASRRRHRNRAAITVLNVALGWTLLGWVAALVWANTSDVEVPSATEPEPSWMKPAALPASKPAAERTCPFCAETIKAAAIVCKHCGRDVPPLAPPAPIDPATRPDDIGAEADALGIIWSPVAERYMWRKEFFKDLASAVAYAKANS